MNRNLARAVWIIVCMTTLALVPARAQREAAGAAAQRVDTPKMHRKGINAIPQHYIVVMDASAADTGGRCQSVHRQGHRAVHEVRRRDHACLRQCDHRFFRMDDGCPGARAQ